MQIQYFSLPSLGLQEQNVKWQLTYYTGKTMSDNGTIESYKNQKEIILLHISKSNIYKSTSGKLNFWIGTLIQNSSASPQESSLMIPHHKDAAVNFFFSLQLNQMTTEKQETEISPGYHINNVGQICHTHKQGSSSFQVSSRSVCYSWTFV